MNKLEDVARAILMEDYGVFPDKGRALRMASAAVEAMREPTVQMFFAGEDEHNGDPGAARHVWAAMIDAILNEKPE